MTYFQNITQLIKKNFQEGSIGTFFTYIILGLLLVGGFVFVGGIPTHTSPTSGNQVIIVTPTQEASKKSLQLETFGYVTITPTPPIPAAPKKMCGPTDDNGKLVSADCKCIDASVVCKSGQPYDDYGNPLTGSIGDPPLPVYRICGTYLAPGDGRYCVAKPIIYLYPEHPMLVSVTVASTGHIVISDPTYTQNGWQNILANPNGNLLYSGKQYSELFYETDVTTFEKPKKGIIIPTNKLKTTLGDILDRLGLQGNEKKEFLSYWLPKLQSLNTPYIYFSLIDKSVKDKIDNVIINPQPDTQIAFIAYFKPITDTSSYDNTLTIPSTPVRKGFVSVEWGGVIDFNNETLR
ncbi:MAG TPA: hypothetical protein VND99_02960 [Candidatus Acidoferrales bacterium]|nr:hypothetical protein [Candidatus Acidoferrales bacterium]